MSSNSTTQDDKVDILILGFGAIGTMYGYILSQNPKVRVTGIARTSYNSLKDGITIKSEKFGEIQGWKPYRLVRQASEANDRSYSYIICCFKSLPDLLPSCSILAPFLDGSFAKNSAGQSPTVVLIQNGIGIEHPIQVAYPEVPIISVVAWIGANLLPGGIVTHGILEKLVIGLYEGEGHDASIDESFGDPAGYKSEGGELRRTEGIKMTHGFADLLKSGGGGVEVADDIQPKRYEKAIWNAAWSSICAVSRSPVSAVVAPPVLAYTLPVIRRTMLEVLSVARAWGYGEEVLPTAAVENAIKITLHNYQVRPDAPKPPAAANFKPSMLLDVEAGRPCELEPIIGSLLDRARVKGVETPRLDLIYAALKTEQDNAIRRVNQKGAQNVSLKKINPSYEGTTKEEWEAAMSATGNAALNDLPLE